MKSAKVVLLSTLVAAILLVVSSATPVVAVSTYRVTFQSQATGSAVVIHFSPYPNVDYYANGSGRFALSGTSRASNITQIPYAAQPPNATTFWAAIVPADERPNLGGSMNVRWTDSNGTVNSLNLRFSPSKGLGPSPDLFGQFYYLNDSYAVVVNFTGIYSGGQVSTPISGSGVVFAIGKDIGPTIEPSPIPATIAFILFVGGVASFQIMWMNGTMPSPYVVFPASSFMIRVKLV